MSDPSPDSKHQPGELRLWREDGSWIAQDQATGTTVQAPSREMALNQLDAAITDQLTIGDPGPTTEEREVLDIESDGRPGQD